MFAYNCIVLAVYAKKKKLAFDKKIRSINLSAASQTCL